jgi:hypothetical protein
MELPLKDIHLSEPISWWPLAFGWWIAFGMIVIIICLAAITIRKYMRPTLKKEAATVLNHIEKAFYDNGDAGQCLCGISALLRRVTLKIYSTEHAGLTGEAWLQILDKPLKDPEFSQGIGRILLHAPYQPYIDRNETSELLRLCRKWVNSL